MATLRNIRRRISSVRSTQQITKAMKMVAAAKLRKAQNRLLSARPYAHQLSEIIGHVAARSKRKLHPLLEVRAVKKIAYVLVTADRGLCGSFNSNLIRRMITELEAAKARKVQLITVGRKGFDFFHRREMPILATFKDFFNELDFTHAQLIAEELSKLYTSKKADMIVVIYNEFKSAVQQEIVVEQLLPIQPVLTDNKRYPVGFIFEPNAEAIMKQLCPMHLNVQMWRILLESSASEFGARMTSMETASENAEEMIKELVLYYNKARQASITKELTEIVGGADALKG
jgi:F-type H+-transporting ATPase subunit gamma